MPTSASLFPERRKFIAIVNPISGRRSMLPRVQEVREILQQRGASMEIAVTRGPEDATRIAAQVDSQADALLVAGGDGTACEVFNGLAGRKLPVAVFSSGTENLLARELRMPRAPRAIAHVLQHDLPREIDVGLLNGKRFMVVAGIGFDAECVARMNQLRRGHITHGDYFWPIWRTLWGHRFPYLEVETDGERVFEGRGLVLIGNMSRYSVGLRPLMRARPNDGLLDVIVLPCRGKLELLFAAQNVFRRRHLGQRGVVYRQCREFRVTSPDGAMMEQDGEFAGALPAVGSVLPGSASLLGATRE
ncbi:MAG: diacylglycerol kinase family lipid kinase [Planctomycetes bacterium]|nr:diacylglycerol kinase family lipid kinase [Planctomycetota bacterium]MBI3833300.1 diacylglycerol kinase family lipid kinase [Planctomycetota bacterium]